MYYYYYCYNNNNNNIAGQIIMSCRFKEICYLPAAPVRFQQVIVCCLLQTAAV